MFSSCSLSAHSRAQTPESPLTELVPLLEFVLARLSATHARFGFFTKPISRRRLQRTHEITTMSTSLPCAASTVTMRKFGCLNRVADRGQSLPSMQCPCKEGSEKRQPTVAPRSGNPRQRSTLELSRGQCRLEVRTSTMGVDAASSSGCPDLVHLCVYMYTHVCICVYTYTHTGGPNPGSRTRKQHLRMFRF